MSYMARSPDAARRYWQVIVQRWAVRSASVDACPASPTFPLHDGHTSHVVRSVPNASHVLSLLLRRSRLWWRNGVVATSTSNVLRAQSLYRVWNRVLILAGLRYRMSLVSVTHRFATKSTS